LNVALAKYRYTSTGNRELGCRGAWTPRMRWSRSRGLALAADEPSMTTAIRLP